MWRCKNQSRKLRQAIEEGTTKYERLIHVHLPSIDEHTVHPTGDVSLKLFSQNILSILFCFIHYSLVGRRSPSAKHTGGTQIPAPIPGKQAAVPACGRQALACYVSSYVYAPAMASAATCTKTPASPSTSLGTSSYKFNL